MKMIKKIWKDPVGSKIIFALISALVVYLAGLWPSVKASLLSVWHFLGAKTATPHWLLGLFIIASVILIIALLDSVLRKSSFHEYTHDYFFDLKWGWSYDRLGQITNIHCLCPRCDYQIIPDEKSDSFRVVEHCAFYCEECHYLAKPFKDSHKKLNQTITLKIQKNIRTGGWEERIQQLNHLSQASGKE